MSLTICIISNEPWGSIWFSKQHYAYELAKLGHKVTFLNPVGPWNLSHIFSTQIHIHESGVHPNLQVAHYQNNLPLRIFPKTIQRINDWLNSKKLKRIIPQKGVFVWQFDPTRFIKMGSLHTPKRIYHVVDPMDAFWGDKEVAQRADLVVGIRQEFYNYYKKLNERVIHVPHGVSADEFAFEDEGFLREIQQTYASCILFIGTLNPDVDLTLIKESVERFPNTHFLLIGPLANNLESNFIREFDQLKGLANLSYLEFVPAQKMKYYISAARVCLVPYNSSDHKFKRTPLKTIHYLSQYKPVISTVPMEELDGMAVYHAKGKSEFIAYLHQAIHGNLSVNNQQVHQYLELISYPNLIQNILSQVSPNI